jgi:hypothetical protein
VHKNGGLFFGTAKESDQGDSGIQNIGTGVVNPIPGDYFELIVRQTSGSTRNVAANELTWFAIEVVEWIERERELAVHAAGFSPQAKRYETPITCRTVSTSAASRGAYTMTAVGGIRPRRESGAAPPALRQHLVDHLGR